MMLSPCFGISKTINYTQMKVIKFGGSSVADQSRILKVIDIIKNSEKGQQLVIVASAFDDITDTLEKIGNQAASGDENYHKGIEEVESFHLTLVRNMFPLNEQSKILSEVKLLLNQLDDICHGIFLLKEVFPRIHDFLLGFGERFSSLILSGLLNSNGIKTVLVNAGDIIITDENFGNAQVDFNKTFAQIKKRLSGIKEHIFVPGFIASSYSGKLTTLGRGGSDYTASILAAALKVDILEIWTDVNGVMTADPKRVSQAISIQKLSYEEIMELSHFGAKVIYPPTISPVMKAGIPVLIKNTFHPEFKGTLISNVSNSTALPVRGLSHIENISLLTLSGGSMVGVTGIDGRLFSALSAKNINIIFITQASSEHSISIAISNNQIEQAEAAAYLEFKSEIEYEKISTLSVEKNLSIIALVGDKMKSSAGISGKAFDALGKNGINIRAIAQGSTERNISIVISDKDVSKALNVLHESFFLSPVKKIHLFLVGVGNVGGELIHQINTQAVYLKKEFGLELKIVGLANSRKMLFDENGINISQWKALLGKEGEKMSLSAFIDKMKKLNLRNSVFVDNTASKKVAGIYKNVLDNSISVVASNKIAASSSYQNYQQLLGLSKSKNVGLLYETNVGAGLPVIKTIQDMIKSGDKIFKIQAVLSGSLNFIFNHFEDGKLFSDVVKEAMNEGYTEPDPRIDLSGEDVMRKILILARETGLEIEFNEVKNKSFMPEELMKADSVKEFLKLLPEFDNYFENIRRKAENNNARLRYIATLDNEKAEVGLNEVFSGQPYYQLDGKDNIVLIFSRRYNEQPLVIKGAGAGASVTASGVFADIISLSNQ